MKLPTLIPNIQIPAPSATRNRLKHLPALLTSMMILGGGLAARAQITNWWLGQDAYNGAEAYWTNDNNWATTEQGISTGNALGASGAQNYLAFGKVYNNSSTSGLTNFNGGYYVGFQIYFKSDAPAPYILWGSSSSSMTPGLAFSSDNGIDPNIQNEGTYTNLINFVVTNANNNGATPILNINENSTPGRGPITFNAPIYGSSADAVARTLSVGGGTIVFNGAINDGSSGSTLALTVGGGTNILNAVNTYSGPTVVNGGVLQLGVANAINNADAVTVNSGGALDLNGHSQTLTGTGLTVSGTGISNGGSLINSSSTGATLSSPVALGANASLGGNGSGGLTVSGVIGDGGNSYSLTKIGTGATTLSGANTYSGPTILNNNSSVVVPPSSSAGALVLNNTISSTNVTIGNYSTGGTSGNSALQLGVDNALPLTAKLSFDGNNNTDFAYLKLMGHTLTVASLNEIAGDKTGNTSAIICNDGGDGTSTQVGILVVSNTTPTTYAGRIRDSINGTSTTGHIRLVKTGSGTLFLTGPYSTPQVYTRGTIINSGTLDISGISGTGFSAAATITNSGGTLYLGSTILTSVSYLQLTSSGTISGTGIITSTAAFDLQSGTISAGLAGSVSLNKTTTGTVILSGVNNYTGNTTNSAGILEADNNAALGKGTLIMNGGLLSNNVSSTLTNPVALAANSVIGVGSSQNLTLSGLVSGSGYSLTKTGAGTLALSAGNTFSGNIFINSGSLALSGGGSISSSPNIIVGAGATFDVSSVSSALTLAGGQNLETIGAGSFPGIINTASGKNLALATGGQIIFNNYDGANASLTVNGAGSLVLAAGNTIDVTNSAGILPAGTYLLVSKGAGSAGVTGIAPTTVNVYTSSGASGLSGTVASLIISNNALYLIISSSGIGVPTQLVFSPAPSTTATAGQLFAQQPVVLIEDVLGNVVNTNLTVNVSANVGTLQGTTSVAAVNGVSTFSDLFLTNAGVVSLTFSCSGLPVTNASVTVSAGTATNLAVTIQPSGVVVASADYTGQPVVAVVDQYGNTVASYSTTVTASLNSPGTGTLANATATTSSGVVTFSGMSSTNIGTYTLHFTADSLTAVDSSGSVTVIAANTNQLSHPRILVDCGGWNGNSGTDGGFFSPSPATYGSYTNIYWNNFTNFLAGGVVNNLITTNDIVTTIGISNTVSWQGVNGPQNGALLSPSIALLGDFGLSNATEDYFYTFNSYGSNPSFKVTGLSATNTYQLSFFGSRQTNTVPDTRFTINTLTGANGTFAISQQTTGPDLGHDGLYSANDSNIVSSLWLVPDINNQVSDIVTSGGTGANVACYMNVLAIIVNRPPVANNFSTGCNPGGTLTLTTAEVLAYVTDPDGDTLHFDYFSYLPANSTTNATSVTITGNRVDETFDYTVDDGNGLTNTATVTVITTGAGVTPVITSLPVAGPLSYGQPLASSTLTGGSVTNIDGVTLPGTFTYTIPSQTPPAGVDMVSVTFTPTDTTNYNAVITNVTINVSQTTPTLTAPTASNLVLGRPLSSASLSGGSAINGFNNATVAGSFVFAMPSLEPTNQGPTNVLITFLPTDTSDYLSASVTVPVNVAYGYLAFFGTSVMAGQGSSGFAASPQIYVAGGSWSNSYAALYTTGVLLPQGWAVTNDSLPGDNSFNGANRFISAIVPQNPNYVFIGYSLGNDGLGTVANNPVTVTSAFATNLTTMINEARNNGYYPVTVLCYARDDIAAAGRYPYMQRVNLLINSWNIPSVNLDGAVDNGNGGLISGVEYGDGVHPNDYGHRELFYTIPPTLFEAIAQGKTNSPCLAAATNFARLSQTAGVDSPLTFTPSNTMHSFTMSFHVRSTGNGTVAAIQTGSGYATLQIINGQFVYVSTNGAQIVAGSINATNGDWHDVALSFRYALTNTWLFVDGVTVGSLTEQYVPTQFILGGPGASGAPAAPAIADLQDWCVYRSAWNQLEAQAQVQGNLQQASMEIGAMLDDSSFVSNSPAVNRAQSLSVPTVNTANLVPMQTVVPPGNLQAQGLPGASVGLTWSANSANGFVLERQVATATNWTIVAVLPSGTTSYTDTGLTVGTIYNYRVAAQEGSGLQGNYSNIATTSPGAHQTILVDFGANDGVDGTITTSPDWLGQYWNNVVGTGLTGTINPAYSVTNLVTTTDGATAIGVNTGSTGWSTAGILNGGLVDPLYSLLGNFAVASATEDYFFTQSSASLAITNLDPTLNYRLRLFGTRNVNSTRIGKYIVTGSNGSFTNVLQSSGTGWIDAGTNYYGNNSTIVSFYGIKPSGTNNQIQLAVVTNSADAYAYLGIMEITANHAPVANNVTCNLNAAVDALRIPIASLLSNVTDADGDPISLVSVSASTNNATIQMSGGDIVYSDNNGVADNFNYTVSDGFGGTNTATVSINIDTTPLFGLSQIVNTDISSGTATLNFGGIPGYTYSVARSMDLFTWQIIWTTNVPAGGTFQFVDPDAPQGNAFYRLQYTP